MPYTCVRYQRLRGCSRRWRYGRALVVGGVASVASRGALAGGVRAPSATEARRRVDPGNARRRPARRRRRARDQRSERCLRYRCSAAHLCEPASRGQ